MRELELLKKNACKLLPTFFKVEPVYSFLDLHNGEEKRLCSLDSGGKTRTRSTHHPALTQRDNSCLPCPHL